VEVEIERLSGCVGCAHCRSPYLPSVSMSPEDRRKTSDNEESPKDAECWTDDCGKLSLIEG